MRLRRALDEFIVDGVETTLPLFRTLVRNADVQNGQYDIHWLEDFLRTEPGTQEQEEQAVSKPPSAREVRPSQLNRCKAARA